MKTKPLFSSYFLLSVTFLACFHATFSQPVVSPDIVTSFTVEARIRNGKTGFEAALFTPATPAPGQPGGGEWQLDPAGAPVWNSNGNVYGDQHDFIFSYTPETGTSTLQIDFNRDGDFSDPEESTSSTVPELTNHGFTYINLYLQGSTGGITANISDLLLNGVSMGGFSSTDNEALSLIYEDASGFFKDITVSGRLFFSGGLSQEIPRIWIRLASAVPVICSPVITPLIPEPVVGQCQVEILEFPVASNGCGDTLAGTTSDPLVYSQPGTYSIHWNFDDGLGHTASCIQSVEVIDTTPPEPVVPSLPEIRGFCAVSVTQVPTSMDICDGIIVADSPDSMHYTLPGSYTIRWVYSDSTGNSTTQLQTVIVEKILSDCPEDLNQDTLIDIQDYLMIVGDFGKVCTCCPGDLDQNQSIEVNDYLMVVGKFGQVCN